MEVQSQFIEMFGNCQQVEKLSSLCDTFIDGDWIESKDQSDEGIRLVQTGNVGNGFFKGKEDKCRFISDETFDRLHCTEIFSGDILVSRLPDPIGRACMIPNGLGRTITAVDCSIIRLKESILADFFIAYTMTPNYSAQINEVTTGTTRRRVSRANLGNVKVPVPQIDKQKQFVSIAEQADKSKFVGFKSQFIEMFGTLDEPKVEIKKLIDVVLGSGQYGSNTSATDYQESMPRYIRITDINDDGSLNDDIKTAEVIDDKFRLVSGDIVFARTGATVGKTYLHEAGDAIYAGYLIKYQMDTNLMKPSFMKAFTHSKTYYDWVANSQKVGAQPNISATQYDQMPILVPSVCDQEAFLKIYQQADKSKFELRKSIEAIDRVIKSLINNV